METGKYLVLVKTLNGKSVDYDVQVDARSASHAKSIVRGMGYGSVSKAVRL